jgi:tetratricopeptide (TPR) repeat protein
MRRRLALLLGVMLGGLALEVPLEARAENPDSVLASAARQVTSVSGDVGAINAAIQRSRTGERTAAQRIADAVLLRGAKDYDRAISVLNEVLEKHGDDAAAYPDALHLLGETYFDDKQYLSARRAFRQIVERSSEPRFARYQADALSRLVDIALRTRDLASLDSIFASMSRVPQAAGSALAYARGKGLLAKGDVAGAKASLAAVDTQSDLAHQARYLIGLVAVKEATPPPEPQKPGEPPPMVPPARYAQAIELFRRVVELPAKTPDQKRIVDLAWIAMGRLYYETEQFSLAASAYGQVDRTSPEFSSMLYELGWVYVRLGDVERAQRALEVLSVADPSSRNIADSQLLRADLMLRAGQFDKSLQIYEGVRGTYDPVRDRVEAFLTSTSDPAVYYDKLSQEQLDVAEGSGALPAFALQWAREAEDGPAAFAVIDEVVLCRDLIKQSNELIERLNALLSSPNRVRAFPELKAGEEKGLALLNRIAGTRLSIGRAMDEVDDGALAGEIAAWRAKRRSLEQRLSLVPVSDADFQDRENQAMRQWNGVSQALQRYTLQVDSLQATINGLRRMLREGPQAGVVRDPASVARFEAELVQNERDITLYRRMIEEIRRQVRMGRAQVGFGDQRFIEDAEVRRAYREALSREAQLAASGAAGPRLASFAARVGPVLQSADQVDARIEASLAELEAEVTRKTSGARDTVNRETTNMVSYAIRLDELDRDARLVVGEVAMRNFGLVRDRLKNIVLRADVGITEQAWEVREAQLSRVRSLRVERSREDQLLKQELNEVLDDSGEPEEAK